MKLTDRVNVFHGCGFIDLPEPRGLAAAWAPIKAITGNTTPAATLPFGKYSVSPYSGGYPTGYGVNRVTCEPRVDTLMDELRLKGFAHFQNSGTGAITVYYNYALLTPSFGEGAESYGVRGEEGRPGYYAVTLAETGIRAELTVSPSAAMHRYTFPHAGGIIAGDFTNDGLYDGPALRGKAEAVKVTVRGKKTLLAEGTYQRVRLFFVLTFEGEGALDAGGTFRCGREGPVTVRVSCSAESAEDALAESEQARAVGFDEARSDADAAWEEALGRITLDGADDTEAEIFYSNLYHTLVKPVNWGGGGFLWHGAPFVTDFSTLWDMYKTQLPLVFSLYPEMGEAIVAMLTRLGQTVGFLPNTFMLAATLNLEDGQARMLSEYALVDAWRRGVKADWDAALDAMEKDMESADFRLFAETGYCRRATYTLDMAEIMPGMADLAESRGRQALAERLRALAKNWVNAFDEDGLMKARAEYYEGNRWNYSFRPMVHPEARMALAGGREAFLALLDRFFGFTDAEDRTARFQGFNNETDMEAPYAYHTAGCREKLCAILDAGDKYAFRTRAGGTGRGGLPGNNDSGGLSSCHIWNTLGLFPVPGQNKMLLSRPRFAKAVIRLANGNTLTVRREGQAPCPARAALNGRDLPDFTLSVGAFMGGGELVFRD